MSMGDFIACVEIAHAHHKNNFQMDISARTGSKVCNVKGIYGTGQLHKNILWSCPVFIKK
jgi:hypothetical protein